MDNDTPEQKQQQFDEYFRIKHPIKANMRPMEADFVLPEPGKLTQHMPYAFRIASDMAELQLSALRPLRQLSEQAEELVEFLNHQSRKIDLMMSYVLQQQDDPAHQYQTLEFGGGGVVLHSQTPVAVGTLVELKLFLEDEAAALFCYAEVLQCASLDHQQGSPGYALSLVFRRIREQDQELLVRASLHLQTKQLKQRHQHSSEE